MPTYEERLRALAAALPAAEAPPGLLELSAAMAVANGARARLDASPGLPRVKVLQAAADLQRGTAAANEWSEGDVGYAHEAVLAALGLRGGGGRVVLKFPGDARAALASPALSAERAFLEDCSAANYLRHAAEQLVAGRPPPANEMRHVLRFATVAAEVWA